MTRTTIGVKIDARTRERLQELAEARERTPHWLVKEAIAEYLTREERVEQERREDDQRWERYVLTGEAVEHEQVRSWLEQLAQGEDGECPG